MSGLGTVRARQAIIWIGLLAACGAFPATGLSAAVQAATPPGPTLTLLPLPPPLPPDSAPLAPQLQHMPRHDAAALVGEPVRNINGQTVGHLVDVLIDKEGHPKAGVIEFEGFLGLGTRKIAVAWKTLRFNEVKNRLIVTVMLDAAKLKALPVYSPSEKTIPLATAP